MKSIYEETYKDVKRLMQDEFDDPSRHENPKLNKQERIDICIGVKQALEQAQKQEELLKSYQELYKDYEVYAKQRKLSELYKELSELYEKLYTMKSPLSSLNSNYYEIGIFKLRQQIKEMENDK